MPLQIRRGTEAQRQAMTVPLAVGEPLFVTDTGSIWVGDGVSPGGVQVTGLTVEDSVDAVASALVAGINQNITFIYGTAQDQANRIDARLDLSSVEGTIDADGFKGPLLADDSGVIVNSANRNITANDISANAIIASNLTLTGALISSSIVSDFKGSVFADDSTILVNSVESSINLNQTIKDDVVPAFDDSVNLGGVGSKFASLYLGADGLYINGAQIQGTISGSIDLPEGSTVNGIPIASLASGVVEGSNYGINIIGDDSTIIVNSDTKSITANNIVATNIVGNTLGYHTGDVKGSVFGDDSSILVDSVENKLYGNQVITSIIDAETSPLIIKSSYFDTVEIQGLIGGQVPSITINSSAGDIDAPEDTVADDIVGSFKVQAWNGIDYKFASAMLTRWASDADFSYTFPKADIIFSLGDNSETQSITASLDGNGTFYARTLQTGIYTSTPETRPTGVKGMIIFNDTSGKFQGFDGSVWVDLS